MNEPLYRDFDCLIDRAALDTRASGDERIPIAISSERPVWRHDRETGERFLEVLDHAPASINMERASRGLALLKAHDGRDQYGKVEDIVASPDRVLRGRVRFSRGQIAQEIRQDMLDDIRTDVSVGYDPGAVFVNEVNASGDTVRRYTNWTPYEVSTVPIPADPTVGKGRALGAVAVALQHPEADEARSVPLDTTTVPTAPTASVTVAPSPDARTRESTIFAFAESAGLTAREAGELVATGRSEQEIGRELLARMNRQAEHSTAPTPAVVLTDKEQRQYSLMAALNGIASGRRSGFEFEVSDEFAKRTGRGYTNDNSFFVPLNMRTQLSIGASTKGPELRATELRPELIDLLRQKSIAIGTLGASYLPGLVGNVAFPRQTAAMTGNWVAEAPGSEMALSSLTLDQVTLSPKTLQASTTVSRQLVAQSTPAADAIVFNDIIMQHAVAIDTAVLYGLGTGNQPTGVGVVTGTNLVAMGTNGSQMTLAKLLEGLRVIEVANAMTDNVKFVTTPGIKYSMAGIARFATTDSKTLYDLDSQTAVGTPAFSTNNLPSTLTKGTAVGTAHAALIGDFSQVLIGEWGAGAEIIVDPYTLARRNLLQITSIQFTDVQIRVPSAFAVYRDLLV